jgi:uncharacterized protein (DUF305 family)
MPGDDTRRIAKTLRNKGFAAPLSDVNDDKESKMKMLTVTCVSLAVLAAATGSPAMADQASAGKEYKAAMEKMDAAMMKGMDPDPTKAWAKMMIAHHQGAIDMSMTVLKETKDPMIRRMAEKGIKEQTEEQKMLEDWIGKH